MTDPPDALAQPHIRRTGRIGMSPLRLLLAALLAVVTLHGRFATTSLAQVDRPQLMLNASGPVGGIRSVAFSPGQNGLRLYAAGAGKAVYVWDVIAAGDALRAIPVDPLRWEIRRGHRGSIFAMDVAAGSGEIAIGGYGARDPTGDLIVFDGANHQILSILPIVRPVDPPLEPPPGHTRTDCTVDFSTDGKHLVSVSNDGEVRLWRNWRNQGLQSDIVHGGGKLPAGPLFKAAFVDNNRLFFGRFADEQPVKPDEPRRWQVAYVETSNPARPLVYAQSFLTGGLAAIAVNASGKSFAVADFAGNVTLMEGDVQLTSRTLNRASLPHNRGVLTQVASLSFGPRERLAITTTADASGACWLELWDATSRQLIQREPLGQGEAAYCGAFSQPDGRLLAVTRADRSAVMLIPVTGNDAAPLDVAHALSLDGRGRVPGTVQFVGGEGYQIAIGEPNDPDRLLYDLKTLEVLMAQAIPAESRPAAEVPLRLIPQRISDDDTQELRIVDANGGLRCRLILDTSRQGTHRMHTWLRDAEGQPWGVAVATAREDGIFLYSLPTEGDGRLMRYLRDHNDRITGLSVSRDGKYLVSASDDQTVKVWSLAGLAGVNQTFPREDAWGATFAVENGRLVVKTAIGPGIAVHRDLLARDVITQVDYNGNDTILHENDPQSMYDVLANLPLWQTVQLSTERNGQQRGQGVMTTPAWEPLATLFLDGSAEWALWTPQGVYDASASGDELFGWHINAGRGQEPQYFRAEKFRGELEKPDVMRQLLISGSLQEALVALALDMPRSIGNIATDIPGLRIKLPAMGTHIAAGQSMTVTAEVVYPATDPPKNFQPRLYVNQTPGGKPQDETRDGNRVTYSWTVPPTGEQNRIKVKIEDEADELAGLFQDAVVHVTADMATSGMLVHFFGLSGEKYPGGDLPALKYCNNDATDIEQLLRAYAGPHFRIGFAETINDADGSASVTKQTVAERIDEFCERLKSVSDTDLLVVLVAGHGQAKENEYYFIPPDPQLGANPGWEEIKKCGIPWGEISKLTDVPCRKLFLLDTCYSGNVALAEKTSTRLLRRREAMVFAATSAGQLAAGKHPRRDNGLFTGCVILGCQGEADGVPASNQVPAYVPKKDNQVNLLEVVSYVETNVRKQGAFQQPSFTPDELLNFLDQPLFDVK